MKNEGLFKRYPVSLKKNPDERVFPIDGSPWPRLISQKYSINKNIYLLGIYVMK
jgi:hypothetical protein